MRVLVVENNRLILANIMSHLIDQGYEVDHASDGLTGLYMATTNVYDLIVIDIMLPGMDGLQLCQFLRQDARRDTPVIMLTAQDKQEKTPDNFDYGVTAYLAKPFAIPGLSTYIDTVINQARCLEVSDLIYDLETLKITRSGQPLKLDPIGHKLLTILMRRSPAVVRRETLERAVWGDSPPESDSLRSHMHKLRQTLDKPFDTTLLHTIRGIGFRLADLNGLGDEPAFR